MTEFVNNSFQINNDTTEADEDSLTSPGWSWWLLQVGTPIIVLLGLPGNAISLVIMKSRLYRHKSYSHYLSALAIFDSLVLIGKLMRRIDSLLMYRGTTKLFDLYGDVACKVHGFAEHVCYLMCSWLILCMSVERFIAVIFPLKKDLFCRQRNAVTIIAILFAALSYSQIFRLVIFGIEAGSCEAGEVYRDVYVILHVYLYQLLLQFLLPSTPILVFNVAILYRLRCQNRGMIQRSTTYLGSSNLSISKRRKTTCMLMVISFTYLVTILPLLLVSLSMHIALVTDLALAKTLFILWADLRLVLELISEINYASNFYIYVLTGAHFRFAIFHLFRSTRRRGSCTFSYPMATEKERERGYRGSQMSCSRKLTSFTVSQRTYVD